MEVRRLSKDSELYHHGVKGQKWGIRKIRKYYKTSNGRMNEAGKEHYAKLKRNVDNQTRLSNSVRKLFSPKKAAIASGIYSTINGAIIGTALSTGASAVATGAAITGAILGTAISVAPPVILGAGAMIMVDKAISNVSERQLSEFEGEFSKQELKRNGS